MPDGLWWMTATVWMESAGEPFAGQLGVAWVIKTRMGTDHSACRIVLAPQQFSAWNSSSPLRMKLEDAERDVAWASCARAAAAAWYGLLADPTNGATHYLALGSVATVPSWYDATRVTATIGHHTFLKLP
jgi:spore germination cell wall hydrolase CwlJ-like protein